jgi:hypothetical protein
VVILREGTDTVDVGPPVSSNGAEASEGGEEEVLPEGAAPPLCPPNGQVIIFWPHLPSFGPPFRVRI